jgi:hypothetical protein
MSGPDPRGRLAHMTADDVGLGSIDRAARQTTDAEQKAWKLVEALAEDCELQSDGDHEWQKCRRCLAVAELSAPETRLLMRELLDTRKTTTPPPAMPPLKGREIRKGTGDVLRDLAYAQQHLDGFVEAGLPYHMGLEVGFVERAIRVAIWEITTLRKRGRK